MIRLIVEDGGDRRGFKMGDGVLSLGAGPEAKLQLDAPDVAALHVELEVRDGVAILRPQPGVLPPTIDGVPVTASVELKHGRPVIIGGARVTVQYPEDSPHHSSAPAPAPAPQPSAGPAPGTAPGAGPGAPASAGARPGAVTKTRGSRLASSRARKRKSKGAMTSVGLFAGAVAFIAGFVVFIGPKFAETAEEFEPGAHMGAAQRLATRGDYDEALAELDAIPSAELKGALAEQVNALRTEIETKVAVRSRDVHNVVGNEWWRENLDKFHKFFLRGTPEPGAIRFFLERLDYFEAEWPEHPELEWVARMRERYEDIVDLQESPTPTDLAFHVRMMLENDPKDWSGALSAIDDYVRSTSGSERNAGVDKRIEVLAQRQVWFEAKIQQAALDYEEGREGQAFAWLVRIVVYSGDADMSNNAAERMLAFEDIDERLKGYRSKKVLEFKAIAAHPKVAGYLERNPL